MLTLVVEMGAQVLLAFKNSVYLTDTLNSSFAVSSVFQSFFVTKNLIAVIILTAEDKGLKLGL